MKINKLFHWLYALVMFLPILVFIPNVFYFAFNEHAQLENSAPVVTINEDITYKFQTNVLNDENDFVLGNLYHTYLGDFEDWISSSFSFCVVNAELVDISTSDLVLTSGTSYPYQPFDITNSGIFVSFDSINEQGTISFGNSSLNVFTFSYEDGFYISFGEADFYIVSGLNGFIEQFIDNWGLLPGDEITPSDFNIITSASYTYNIDYKDTSITGAVSNGWYQVWELPIFSWSHNTFFSAPFNYISSLFGFTSDNSISYLLSYWFSISLIWLVFDLMIYVPLLVHRWLDKASIS